jgi:hypothetical protein
MTKTINELCLICEKFGFAAQRSKISSFEMQASVVDDGADRAERGYGEDFASYTIALFAGTWSCGTGRGEFAHSSQKPVTGAGN